MLVVREDRDRERQERDDVYEGKEKQKIGSKNAMSTETDSLLSLRKRVHRLCEGK
jgi:hypothetical protein